MRAAGQDKDGAEATTDGPKPAYASWWSAEWWCRSGGGEVASSVKAGLRLRCGGGGSQRDLWGVDARGGSGLQLSEGS